MPQSQTGARRRLAAAGLTTGAVVAAVLVAPTAAYAAPSTTPPVGPPSGTVTVTDTGAFTSATAVGVELRAAADPCSSTYATPSTTVLAGSSPTKVDANTVTFGVPTTLAAGTNGAAKTYNVCIYNGVTAGTSTQITGSGTPTYTVSVASTVSPATGASGGGNTITITTPTASAYFTGITAPAAVFTSSACLTAYGSPTAGTAATVTKTSNSVGTVTVPSTVLGNGTTANPYNVCVYAGNSSSSALLAATTYGATLPTVTPSATIGSSAGGNGIVVTGSTNFLTGVSTAGVAFTTASTCPTTYPSNATYAAGPPVVHGVIQATGPRVLANNKLAVTVPALPLSTGTPSEYKICIYNGASAGTSTILAAAAYSSTTVPAPTAITPNAGPAFGGTQITVTGSNFPTTAGSITATLGGTALSGITPVSSSAFTAITPSHSVANGAALVVTTAAGSATLQNAFTFANAIKTEPNTAPGSSAAVNLDVTGAGFYALSGSAAIYLVNGAYNPDKHPENATYYTNGPVAECGTILVISDTELVCTLPLNARLDETGTAINTVTYSNAPNDIATVHNSNVITSAGGKFSIGDVGHPIAESGGTTHIPAGTMVTAVLSPSRAVISNDALLDTTTAITGTITGAMRTVSSATTTASGTTVTAALGSFSAADIGRPITGTGATIQSGTTITGVNASGTTATLSQAVGAGGTGTVSIFPSAQVPDGAYTLTVVSDGSLDAAATSPSSYTQTVVSSGATFTVAPF